MKLVYIVESVVYRICNKTFKSKYNINITKFKFRMEKSCKMRDIKKNLANHTQGKIFVLKYPFLESFHSL